MLHAFVNHVRARSKLHDSNVYRELQANLVKHIWENFGNEKDFKVFMGDLKLCLKYISLYFLLYILFGKN